MLLKTYVSEFPEHEVNDAIASSGSIIVAHFPIDKQFYGREALNLHISPFLIGVDSCDVGDAFESIGSFFILRG